MKKKKSIVLAVVIIFAVIFLIIKPFSGGKDTAYPVTTEKVQIQPVVTEVSATGCVALEESSRFYSSSTAVIKEIYVKEGDRVKKGQLLFTYNEKALDELKDSLEQAKLDIESSKTALEGVSIETDQSQLKEYSANIKQCDTNIASIIYKIQQLNIQINQAENDLARAKTDLENDNVLYTSGGLSLDELKASEAEYNRQSSELEILKSQKQEQGLSLDSEKVNKEAAQAKYDHLLNQNNTAEIKNKRKAQEIALKQSQLKADQIQAEIYKFKTQETAPYDGIIINIQEDFMSGAAISEGTYLFGISDEKTVVNLDVPEYDMQSVALKQPVTLTCDGYDEEFKGIVTKIYPTAEKKTIKNSEKNVVTVQVTLDKHTDLSLGYSVDGRIITSTNENALVIPVNSYLTDETGKDYVYVINSDNTISKKYISIKTYDNMYIEVEGLNLSENVVTAPDENILTEGMEVTVSAGENK
ncbi:MAG: efflux RND transporter periplasmic adaptor subunit [Clostridia bacterium]|nr:efflux RND transporter periplasmic adaptor subunit [Clostridia bacterium]